MASAILDPVGKESEGKGNRRGGVLEHLFLLRSDYELIDQVDSH